MLVRGSAPLVLRLCGIMALLAGVASAEPVLVPTSSRLNAVDTLPGGGFVVAGQVQPQGEPAIQRAALWFFDENGSEDDAPVEISLPAGNYENSWVTDVVVSSEGDIIGVGWVWRSDETDAWIFRATGQGAIISNDVIVDPHQDLLYVVRESSPGVFYAAGHRQVSPDEAASGLIVKVSLSRGSRLETSTVPCPGEILRCGFRGVTETIDRTPVLSGWMTTAGDGDDVWIYQGEASNGSTIPFQRFPGSDLGVRIAQSTDDTYATGVVRDSSDGDPHGFIARVQSDGGPLSPSWVQGGAAGRIWDIYSVPAADRLLVVGSATADAASSREGYAALINPSQATASDPSKNLSRATDVTFYGVTIGPSGSAAAVGALEDPQAKSSIGYFATFATSALCSPDLRALVAIEAALADENSVVQGCARAGVASRLKLTDLPVGYGLLVRPIIGDIDAALLAGEEVVATSLNTNNASEFITGVESAGELQLVISTADNFATFEIRWVPIQLQEAEEDPQDGEIDFSAVGYDPTALLYQDDMRIEASADSRPILWLQATAGQELTGAVDQSLLETYFDRRGKLAEAVAARAARIGWRVADSFEETRWSADRSLVSFKGGLEDGTLYGVGEFKSGGVFAGAWEGSAINGDMEKLVGVMQATQSESATEGEESNEFHPSGTCAVSMQTQFQDDGGVAYTGTVSWNGELLFSGGIRAGEKQGKSLEGRHNEEIIRFCLRRWGIYF